MTPASSTGPILVINPNSNEAVTAGLDAALEGYRRAGAPAIECVTLREGPFGIESQAQGDLLIAPLLRLVESRSDAAAIVIACYSDPGLDSVRSITRVPAFGIQESGVLAAMGRGDRFGVIAISGGSVARHRRYMRRMGVLDRCAGDRPLDMTVDESARGEATFGRLVDVGTALIGDGADVLILGCAGLARHRATLQAELGIPVIDPTQAAVAAALLAVVV